MASSAPLPPGGVTSHQPKSLPSVSPGGGLLSWGAGLSFVSAEGGEKEAGQGGGDREWI